MNAFSEGNNGRSPIVREFKAALEEEAQKFGATIDKFEVVNGTPTFQSENEEAADALLALVKRMPDVQVTVVESSFDAFLAKYTASKKGGAR